MTDVTIRAADGGSFHGYLATPAGGKGPGIVVIQEIFGVNDVMRGLCDALAKQGYVALCPDLFWRQEPGIQLSDKTDAEWARAFQLYQGFDEAKGVDDLKATLATLRAHPAVTGKVGSVGYCLGGKLAYLMATRTDADASVSYYGVGIDAALDEVAKIKKPLLMHIAGKDKFVPPAAQAAIQAAVNGNAHITTYVYAEQDHAFARTDGIHWDQAAAKIANDRTAAFFAQHLK